MEGHEFEHLQSPASSNYDIDTMDVDNRLSSSVMLPGLRTSFVPARFSNTSKSSPNDIHFGSPVPIANAAVNGSGRPSPWYGSSSNARDKLPNPVQGIEHGAPSDTLGLTTDDLRSSRHGRTVQSTRDIPHPEAPSHISASRLSATNTNFSPSISRFSGVTSSPSSSLLASSREARAMNAALGGIQKRVLFDENDTRDSTFSSASQTFMSSPKSDNVRNRKGPYLLKQPQSLGSRTILKEKPRKNWCVQLRDWLLG